MANCPSNYSLLRTGDKLATGPTRETKNASTKQYEAGRLWSGGRCPSGGRCSVYFKRARRRIRVLFPRTCRACGLVVINRRVWAKVQLPSRLVGRITLLSNNKVHGSRIKHRAG